MIVWEIVFETGEYEDKQQVPFERFDSEEKAANRLTALRADLTASGCDKPLPPEWVDDDDVEWDRRWNGFMVDYTGASLHIRAQTFVLQ
jgi:hypothetical protein